jgi:hypothetical protein
MKIILPIIGSFALLESVSASGCAASPLGLPGNLTLGLIPFVAFLILFHWGLQRKNRKEAVIRLGYMLIALEILLFGLVPYSVDGLSCTGVTWVIPAMIMLLVLSAFIIHRRSMEQMHDDVISTARMRGHLVLLPEPRGAEQKKVLTDHSKYMPPEGIPEPEPELPVVETGPVTVSKAEVVEETEGNLPLLEETEKPPLARKVETETKSGPDHKDMEALIKRVVKKSRKR